MLHIARKQSDLDIETAGRRPRLVTDRTIGRESQAVVPT